MMGKVQADLQAAGKSVTETTLKRHLGECEAEARKQVMSE
jgi:hypothetical protein